MESEAIFVERLGRSAQVLSGFLLDVMHVSGGQPGIYASPKG